MNETHRIWYFYHKSDKKNPYAVTDKQHYAKRFLEERNAKKFKVKTKDYDDTAFLSELHRYRSEYLSEIPINSTLDDTSCILATMNEEIKLHLRAEEMENEMDRIYRHLCIESNIQDKYKYAIEYLTTTSYTLVNNDREVRSTIKLMTLFVNLFKDTL